VWIRLTHAASRLGLSRSSFLVLAEREGIAITERYGRRGVTTPQLDAYVERCRIPPASYGPELVPYKGPNGPAEVRHLDLLDAVVAGLSWTDARLAREVGVNTDTVARWRSAGVPTATCRPSERCEMQPASGVSIVWISPLCCPGVAEAGWSRPWEAARSAGSLRGVALMDQGEGPVRMVQRRPRRRSGRRPR
jgi:hypothetical protein